MYVTIGSNFKLVLGYYTFVILGYFTLSNFQLITLGYSKLLLVIVGYSTLC